MKKEISSVFDTIATSPPKKVRRLWREGNLNLSKKEPIQQISQQPEYNKLNENSRTHSRTILGQSQPTDAQRVTKNLPPQKSSNSRTILGQSEDNSRTILGQPPQNPENSRTQPRTHSRTILGQSEDNSRTKSAILSLVGLQRKIFIFLYTICRSLGTRTTPIIATEKIIEFTQSTVLSVRKTIQRLEKKGLLLRLNFKTGRGGWTKYELPESIFREATILEFEDNSRTILGQSEDNSRTQPRTQPRTSPPSSSSYILYNKTTTTGGGGERGGAVDNSAGELFDLSAQNLVKLSPEWASVDPSPLEPFGFTQSHLHQIIQQNKLTPDVVQQSINAFAYDIRVNKKDKNIKSSLNYFMGILRKGIPYAPSENYKTPEEEALEKYNQWEKASRKKIAELRQQTEDLEFKKWKDALNLEEKQKIAPGTQEETLLQIARLREYFNQKIWADLKEKVFQSILEKTKNTDEKK